MNLVQFDTDPSFRRAGRGRVQLCEPLKVVDFVTGLRFWEVPVGYVTDGATIPSWAWMFIGSNYGGAFFRPASWHDCMVTDRSHGLSSASCALRFYHALRSEGVGRFRAKVMYLGVRYRGPQWAGA